jgi:SAM-dependent methyltransferase
MFAYFMAREGQRYEVHVHERKRRLLRNLSGTLVEVGAGAGANLRFFPPDLDVIAVEPNPFMHRYFQEEARLRGRNPWVVRGRAEALPFPSRSVDAVLSTLVLCSVENPDQALLEALRVLRPGGVFLFMEHVAARPGTRLWRLQRLVRPAWRSLGDGCEPDRVLEEHVLRAGFSDVDLTRFEVPVPVVGPHIVGVAVK